jgi:UDP-3-O-[3-hydroxymyristoyl] N-acetylglucosamine deacetylase
MKEIILVVDDDARVRESIGDVLRDEGYQVVTAGDGHEAMRRVDEHDPCLVLLDVWMPDLDGIEVLGRIKAARAELPVIVLSGHGNVEMAVKATRMGAIDFIEKPFSIDGLLSSVSRALHPGGPAARGVDGVSTVAVPGATRRGRPTVAQRTIARSVVGSGLGLHSGVRTGLILLPLGPGEGIRFGRVGSEEYIEAIVENVDSTGYATSLYRDGLGVRTVEHLLAALHAYGITNLLIKVEGEVPILDGSAAQFCELIESVGVAEQDALLELAVVTEEVALDLDDDRCLRVTPSDHFSVTYELVYPEPVGEQVYTFRMTEPQAFRDEIAPARTFGFVEEIRALERAGLGQGGKLTNFILIGESGIVNTELRFPEELARHKILDLVGDLYLLGRPLRAAVYARKTGHSQNVAMVRRLREVLSA